VPEVIFGDDQIERVRRRSAVIFQDQLRGIRGQTDHLFARLLPVEWLAGVVLALVVSPRAWEGTISRVHLQVWAAVLVGGLIVSLPAALAWTRSGGLSMRHGAAVGQMLFGALLIHLTGGRIETHFYVFGSLVFLALYRDPMVLVSGSAVIAVDHLVRGIWWPQSVYGVLAATPWRSLEHAAWVIFEDIFLVLAIRRDFREMSDIAERQARLETVNEVLNVRVREATADLRASEERFRSLCDSAPLGIFLTDPAGDGL
jgi:PAS domain-containing protein